MNQTLTLFKEFIAEESYEQILCLYVNVTHRIQTIRITNIPNLHFERVVFPGQRLMFEAVPAAKLEINTSNKVTLLISCEKLRVIEKK